MPGKSSNASSANYPPPGMKIKRTVSKPKAGYGGKGMARKTK